MTHPSVQEVVVQEAVVQTRTPTTDYQIAGSSYQRTPYIEPGTTALTCLDEAVARVEAATVENSRRPNTYKSMYLIKKLFL